MQEAYDREKGAALLKEGRAIIAELKSEMQEIATKVSRVLDGHEEDADDIEGLASGQERRPQLVNPDIASEHRPAGKQFWQFWR